jgi:MFS family permease
MTATAAVRIFDLEELQRVQRRTLQALLPSQVIGGIGVGAAAGVGSLLAARIGHTDSLAGLAGTASALGAAISAVPMSRIMDGRGRRAGLIFGYSLGALGGVVVIGAAAMSNFFVLVLGMCLFGAGNASNLQARYAAVDCATSRQRGTSLSMVIWATTIGAIAGPNLLETGDRLTVRMGLPDLGGVFAISAVAFLVAGLAVRIGLRPDPLLTARSMHTSEQRDQPQTSWRVAARAIRDSPRAVVGLMAMSSANTVMVGVMAMTPVEMSHMGADLHVIGLIISVHIAGMFAFSPLVGWLMNAIGRTKVIVAGQLIMIVAFIWAGLGGAGDHLAMAGGLLLLGLGWSFSLLAGSTLLTESLPEQVRPRAQGLADLTMGLCGASGGAVSGVVVSQGSFGVLNAAALVLILLVLTGSTATRIRHRSASTNLAS